MHMNLQGKKTELRVRCNFGGVCLLPLWFTKGCVIFKPDGNLLIGTPFLRLALAD